MIAEEKAARRLDATTLPMAFLAEKGRLVNAWPEKLPDVFLVEREKWM